MGELNASKLGNETGLQSERRHELNGTNEPNDDMSLIMMKSIECESQS